MSTRVALGMPCKHVSCYSQILPPPRRFFSPLCASSCNFLRSASPLARRVSLTSSHSHSGQTSSTLCSVPQIRHVIFLTSPGMFPPFGNYDSYVPEHYTPDK